MLGQFLVEPELELELPELEEPELELPVFPVLELDDDGAVVDAPVLELEPELVLGVELDVVAALATNAPPARRPVVNAPTASTFRKRSCIGRNAFRLWCNALHSEGTAQRAPPTCGQSHSELGECVELPCERVTILRKRWSPRPRVGLVRWTQARLAARQQYERMGTSSTSWPMNSSRPFR